MACVEEGLFYADDLPDRYPSGYQALLDYPAHHGPAVSREVSDAAWRLELLSAREFVIGLLEGLTIERCFDQEAWKRFVGLVKLDPHGDVLPVRARYGHTESWGIGVNPLELGAEVRRQVDGLWYTIPDAVAAKVLTGRTPKVVDALRLVPKGGKSARLRETRLAGAVPIDPRGQDFFRAVIEERQRVRRSDLPEDERKRLDSFAAFLPFATELATAETADQAEAALDRLRAAVLT